LHAPALELALPQPQLPYPKNSLLPFIPQTSLVFLPYFSTATHQSSLHYSLAALHQISLLLILGAISSTVLVFFWGVYFFAQKCCFFVNLQLLVCLFVF
jgi:hypothetical protein